LKVQTPRSRLMAMLVGCDQAYCTAVAESDN
jgi:hypothetical protein